MSQSGYNNKFDNGHLLLLINSLCKLILAIKIDDMIIFSVVSLNSLVRNGEIHMLIDEGKVVCYNLPSTLEGESYRTIVVSCPRFCSGIGVFDLNTLLGNLDRIVNGVIRRSAIFHSDDVRRYIVAVWFASNC